MHEMVSIVTPCYNGDKFVGRFLQSLYEQTYKKLEIILINDGSTDRTEEIIFQYKQKFEKEGIRFIYIYQENQGQAAAVNKGIKLFTGDYLTWPDSDDFLMSDSIEQRVNYLRQHPEHGFVRSDVYIYAESDLVHPVKKLNRNSPKRAESKLFDRILLEQNMYAMSGQYIVRREALDSSIPNREIFCSRGGQNWQIELPIAYNYTSGYIDKPLYGYVIRENSHSRSIQQSIDKIFTRYDSLKEIIEKTIEHVNLNHEYYKNIIDEKYERLKFNAAINLRKYKIAKEYYNMLKDRKRLHISDRLRWIFKKSKLILKIISLINKVFFYFGIYNF
ncbi:MAG: glycosyltransferase family A protein [Clostridia bacterium]